MDDSRIIKINALTEEAEIQLESNLDLAQVRYIRLGSAFLFAWFDSLTHPDIWTNLATGYLGNIEEQQVTASDRAEFDY